MDSISDLSSVIMPTVSAPFIGSFLTVLASRHPNNEALWLGRSRCPCCKKPLAAWHLVPVFSWLFLQGRCAYCGRAISKLYPLTEVAALAIAVWAVWVVDGWLVWATCALGWTLLAIAIIDWRHFLNYTWLSTPIPEHIPTDEDLFGAYLEQYGKD